VNRPSPIPNPLDLAYAATLLLGSPVLAYRMLRTGKWRTDWRGRMGHADVPVPDARPTVLLHGVSVGEVAAVAPLVSALADPAADESVRVVVSATTNTGVARARSLFGAEHPVVRHPLDFSRAVHRFLDAVRPDVVALMELEVWPNFTRACRARGIPVVVVNGRLSPGSFAGYRRVRSLVAPSFGRLDGVAAQTEAYARRFRALGVAGDRVSVADSMKWDVELPADLPADAERLGREMGVDPDRPLVVAVSTGPGEERMLLEGRPDGVQLMVVPRKPERFEEVAALAPWVRRSRRPGQAGAIPPDGGGSSAPADLFLVDTMGEAEAATALADVVAVGRSWNGLGASNPVPPALLGKPTVIGPDHENFSEMVEALVADGAVMVSPEAWKGIGAILHDPEMRARMATAGPEAVGRHRGATERNVALIRDVLRGTARSRLG
jgi:3-deoxy-D-manno-octulosonic-acid transferase